MRPMSTTKSVQEMKADQEKMRWISWFGIDCYIYLRFRTGDMMGPGMGGETDKEEDEDETRLPRVESARRRVRLA